MTRISRITRFGVAFNSFRMLVGAIAAIYMIDNGLSVYEVGLIKSVQAITILLTDIPLSYLSDKFSRKLSVSLATLFGAVWLGLMGVADTFQLFMVAEFFNALSLSLLGGAFTAYLIDSARATSETEIKNITSRYSKLQFLFVGCSGFCGGFLYQYLGDYVWYLASALCFFVFASSFMLPSDEREKSKLDRETSLRGDLKAIFNEISPNKVVCSLLVAGLMVVSLYYQILIQVWQPYVISGFNSLNNEGALFGSLFLVLQLSQSLASYCVERMRSVSVVFTSAFTLSAFASALLIYTDGAGVLVGVVVVFCSNLMMRSYFSIKFQALVSPTFRSTIDSIVSTTLRLLLIVSLPLSGATIDAVGWLFMSLMFAGTSLIALAIYLLIPKESAIAVAPDAN